MEGKLYLGSFGGEWFLLLDARSNGIFFSNLTDLNKKVHLPSMSECFMSLSGGVVSSSPTTPKCLVVFVGKNQNFVLYCWPSDQKCTKANYNFKSRHFSGDIVSSKGYIYALLSDQRTAFTSLDSFLGIANWTTIQFPRWTQTHYNSPHLLVSCEDVFFSSMQFSWQVVLEISIWSLQDLHASKPNWRRVRSIGPRVFFLSRDNSMSFTMNDEKTQHNCMYILQSDIHGELL